MRSGTTRRPPRQFPAGDVSSVTWSADDKQLAFVDGSGGSYEPNYSAWVMSSDGEGAHRLPRYGEGNVDAVQWLPRHRRVLIVDTDSPSLYLIHPNGTHKSDLPFDVADDLPSPDGRKLLFVDRVSDSSGSYYRSAISLANLDTGQTQQLTQTR
jgi:Tol biopolymer transport system component